MAIFREALIRHLREDTASGGLVEKLDNTATRVRSKGLIKASSTFPMVGVEMAHTSGSPRMRPHTDQLVNIYVYTRVEATNVPDLITLDEIVGLVISRLNNVEVSDMTATIDDDFKPWVIMFDGYISRDRRDDLIRADYRWIRFRVAGVRTST